MYLLLSIATIGTAVLFGHLGGRAHAAILLRRVQRPDGRSHVVPAVHHL